MRLWLAILLLASPVFAIGEYDLPSVHGYEARANGMDWDDDFDYGDAQDGLACDDADTDGAVIVAEDIDGDSELEQQIYVIPATGTDDGDCGGPNAADACDSVQYVIENRLNADADADTEDIICLVGTSHEELQITDEVGVAGTKLRTAAGDEVYDFEYPSNPNVIMGADRDQDGNYPPFDTDDTAVFDGEVGASYLEQFVETSAGDGTNAPDRWELAHFTVQEYGTNDATRAPGLSRGLFMANGPATNSEDHIYYHDIEAVRINYNQEQLSFTQSLLDSWGRTFTYLALENIDCHECCGWITRGNGATSTYLRVKNVSMDFYCEDNPAERLQAHAAGSMKLWGDRRYLEFLYNDWDLSPAPFSVDQDDADDAGGSTFNFNTCIRDAYVVNNILRNVPEVCFGAEGGLSGQCTVTPGDNLNFLRNQCIIDNTVYPVGTNMGVAIKTGFNSETIFHKNITIANNLFADLTGQASIGSMLKFQDGLPVGAPDPSAYTIAIVNNTGYAANWGETGAATEAAVFFFDDDADDQSHSWVIKNNVVAGGSSDDWMMRWVSSGVSCSDVDMDYNIYEDDGGDREFWACDGGQRYDTLALYSAATGLDTNSKGEGQNACDVTFVNRGSDMHLDTADTCAQDESTSTGDGANAYTTIDFDKDARPQNALWDIGFDEYESGYVPVGACCDSACEVTTDAACDLWEGAGTTCTPDPCETEPPLTPVSGFAEGASFKGVSKG